MNMNDHAKHSGTIDKAKGHLKEVVGGAKEQVGSIVGNHELEAEGRVQNAEGKKDRVKGEIKETIEDVKTKAKAGIEAVKDKIDEARGKQ